MLLQDGISNKEVKRLLGHLAFWLAFYLLYLQQKYSVYLDLKTGAYVLFWRVLGQMQAAYGLIYYLIPKFLNHKKYFLFIVLSLVWTYLVFAFQVLIRYYYLEPAYPVFFYDVPAKPLLDRITSFSVYIDFVPWGFTPAVVMGLIRYYKDQQRLSKIEEEKKSLELKFLKNQMNPHFLFNTLNNLYALALKKDERTPLVIAKLAEILDFMLYKSNEDLINLDKETMLIENYLMLEKLRYGEDRMSIAFTMEINESLNVPPLLLLTFIENAIKHGVINEPDKATIHIDLKTKDQEIYFSIRNSKPQNASPGDKERKPIGLVNIRQQLDLLYPGKHTLTIEDNKELFIVNLKLSEI
jgi:hypothetical protein